MKINLNELSHLIQITCYAILIFIGLVTLANSGFLFSFLLRALRHWLKPKRKVNIYMIDNLENELESLNEDVEEIETAITLIDDKTKNSIQSLNHAINDIHFDIIKRLSEKQDKPVKKK